MLSEKVGVSSMSNSSYETFRNKIRVLRWKARNGEKRGLSKLIKEICTLQPKLSKNENIQDEFAAALMVGIEANHENWATYFLKLVYSEKIGSPGLNVLFRYPENVLTNTGRPVPSGGTLLHHAAAKNMFVLAARLLLIEPNLINIFDDTMELPVVRAAHRGHDKMVQLLLSSNFLDEDCLKTCLLKNDFFPKLWSSCFRISTQDWETMLSEIEFLGKRENSIISSTELNEEKCSLLKFNENDLDQLPKTKRIVNYHRL